MNDFRLTFGRHCDGLIVTAAPDLVLSLLYVLPRIVILVWVADCWYHRTPRVLQDCRYRTQPKERDNNNSNNDTAPHTDRATNTFLHQHQLSRRPPATSPSLGIGRAEELREAQPLPQVPTIDLITVDDATLTWRRACLRDQPYALAGGRRYCVMTPLSIAHPTLARHAPGGARGHGMTSSSTGPAECCSVGWVVDSRGHHPPQHRAGRD